ncbi:1,2-diacylglycerol-3-alpha-glucose alpha-1,2-glucosyltransferase [Gracilibacillus ureilyticus]|uniref:1,2-diacylglycerol-3-alpha-glucose alpha-1,2-glucosyltransferase n=1 Tax=Gracilibacillus ureilyticus TaxID=531814 RepID=A0A1H9MRF6_9BACI|nr:glycosyltransferase family 4 protein [Gracilibacillus ureilyticus]SER26218.1 1,2-diacylglycerol-3-alpha-glucose alpha-1,2-glucosyltransferase [Gracilibacillus ureilyticus]
MKVLLYAGSLNLVNKSGIGQAIRHQKKALEHLNIAHTTDRKEDFDIVHLNTIFPNSLFMSWWAKRNGKKVVYYAHSTMEDFRNSFIGSNMLAPLFKKWISYCYNKGDIIITPTEYSKSILETYGLHRPVFSLSNGIDTSFFQRNKAAGERFRKKYKIDPNEKVIISVGHFMERKGIDDFIELAKQLPEYTFYWFGHTSMNLVPAKIKKAMKQEIPNLHFPGFISREELRDAYCGSDLFLFLTHEETEGIVLLEALAAKIPVLVRDIPIYEQWLTDNVHVYKAKQFHSFKEQIVKIAEQQAEDLTENGYKLALEKDIRNISQKLVELYYIGEEAYSG